MDIRTILSQLTENEIMVITACLHHCAVMPKEERRRFQTDYGMRTDKELTQLIKKIWTK